MEYLLIVLVASALLAASLQPALAAEPSSTGGSGEGNLISERFGLASSHLMLTDPQTMRRQLDAMADAQVRWVRCGFAWTDLEVQRGKWDFSRTDFLVEEAAKRGIKVLGILGASPSWANGGQDYRYPPTDLSAWRSYVYRVAARYRGRITAWEIWNEENIANFWKPKADPRAYVRLLGPASGEIRRASPGAKVIFGGVAGLGQLYLRDCFEAGAAKYIDAIAYHPYATEMWGSCNPYDLVPKEERCLEVLGQMKALISHYSAKPLEIWLTEFGYNTNGWWGTVDEKTQAAYMLRTLVNYASEGVDKVFYYSLWDESPYSWWHDHFGLLNNDFSAKPAFHYYKAFERNIGAAASADRGAILSSSCSRPSSLEVHPFRLPDGSLAAAAWKTDDRADSLSLVVGGAALENPERVNLVTGARQPLEGIERGRDGEIIVRGLPVGKVPVILRFDARPGAFPGSIWYLAEGTTDWGFDTAITIANPNERPVTARVTYMMAEGARTRPDLELPARSQTVLHPAEDLGKTDFSTRVECVEGRTIAVDRRMTWTGPGAASAEGHSSVGVTSTSSTWYLPEGSSRWGFETWLLVQNPNGREATLSLTYMTEGVGPRTFEKKIGGNSRASFNMAADIGEADASIKVESDLPVVAERAVYRGNRREGHGSVGTTRPALEYFLAEGTTDWGFKTYLLVQNPNGQEATVTVTYMTPSGPREQAPFTMPAGSRKTIRVNDVLPPVDFSARITGSLPIIAERAMYWDSPFGEACHDSIGLSELSTVTCLPDGDTQGGTETWTLVQNPNARKVSIRVTYLTPTGEGNVTFTDTLEPNSRKTYNMAEHIPDGKAAVLVNCETAGSTIAVERTMYWNARGAGTGTIGASD